jgi:hypothetical protein
MLRFLVLAAGVMMTAATASAQFNILPYPNPYYRPIYMPPVINPFVPYTPWNNGAIIQPWPRPATVTVIGTLPNGIQVINPWGPRINPYFASNFVNPYLVANYSAGYWYGLYNNPFLDSFYAQNAGVFFRPVVIRDPLGFIVGQDAPPLTAGTVTLPDSARTIDGLAPRLPATGSMTIFGAYDPASGSYIRPVLNAMPIPEPSEAK